jgi:hypothetical protein
VRVKVHAMVMVSALVEVDLPADVSQPASAKVEEPTVQFVPSIAIIGGELADQGQMAQTIAFASNALAQRMLLQSEQLLKQVGERVEQDMAEPVARG